MYNFVTKRGLCKGDNSKYWTQVETGHYLEISSCILRGDNSVGEFYSVAVTKGKQQADTGTKMFHVGKNTKSTIISKGISFDDSVNTYRGKVRVNKGATGSRNYTRCDSLMLDNSLAITLPTVEQHNNDSVVEHEASTNKVSEDQLYYLNTLGIDEENATNLIVNGFCKEVFPRTSFEFAARGKTVAKCNIRRSS